LDKVFLSAREFHILLGENLKYKNGIVVISEWITGISRKKTENKGGSPLFLSTAFWGFTVDG
jgi:hypothetical protein